MSAKQPEIKFSPFEALLIGEKNNVLKRQPMKNTIFMTRLNQKSKTINLRALFGLELSATNLKRNDDIFKVPQRVHEFLNSKKHSYERNKLTGMKGGSSCFDFKRHKTFVRSNVLDKSKYKKSKMKSNKVKFKEKCNQEGCGSVVNKVQDALKNQSSIKRFDLRKRSSRLSNLVSKENKEYMCSTNRYRLRNKDYKFTCESEDESSQSDEVNTTIKQDYLSSHTSKFLTDNNKNIFNNSNQIENENLKKFQIPNSIDCFVDLSDPDIFLNELFKYNYYRYGSFEFPKCPETELSDFDTNENLFDIIYESFPKSFKFESEDSSQDFINALINADIIKPVEDEEITLTSNKSEEDERVKVSCGTQTSCLDLARPIDLSSCYHLKTLDNGYLATADGFVTIQNHLITDENFGGLFMDNPNGHDKNDLLMASLMKPLIRNTWVKSLQNF